jgi:hypothetical protein
MVLFPCLTFAQADTLPPFAGSKRTPPILQINLETKFIAVDKLQQLYAVTPSNEVIKYAPDGAELYRYSNNILGDLSYLDATDPFNLLLFYGDYQLILTLDRTMNETAELNLLDLDALQVRAVGMSNDGHIWLYDPVKFRLKKVDANGSILAESQNLSLLLPQVPQPTQLVARENWVYLSDPAQGILLFNNFGQFQKVMNVEGVERFQVAQNRLIFKRNDALLAYDQRTFQTTSIPLPEDITADDQILWQKKRLYIRKMDRIEVYRLK